MRTSARWLSGFLMVALLVMSSAAPVAGRSPSGNGSFPTPPATQLINTPAQQQAMMQRLQALREGETITLGVVENYRINATRSAGQINVAAVPLAANGDVGGPGSDVTAASGPSPCTYAVAAFLWGLGASFLGLAAFLGITITGPFGIVFTPYWLGFFAGLMGSWSVLLGAVSFYIC